MPRLHLKYFAETGQAMAKCNDVDYAEEGRRLLEAVNLGDRGAPSRYSPIDPIWKHPDTGATFYCGGAQLAANRDGLRQYNITRIVNCQDEDGRNYFEGDPSLTYLRFSIGKWRNIASVRDGGNGTWAFWAPYFTFVMEGLRDGQNVYVHCLAGAHRAGTATIGMLMMLCNWEVQEAVSAAKLLRPAISPIGGFPELLSFLAKARRGRDQTLPSIYAEGAVAEVQEAPAVEEAQVAQEEDKPQAG